VTWQMDDLLRRAQAHVDRKYVARADDRQRALGLAYIEAERADLAREMARFACDEINRALQSVQQAAFKQGGSS
jgi:outer membrane lipopolysaccharide assembly protein LptE/RlpB